MKKSVLSFFLSLVLSFSFAQKPTVSNYYIDGELVLSSQSKNTTVQAIQPEFHPGKDMRIFMQISNYSDHAFNNFPVHNTTITVTYKNGKTIIVSPIDPNEYIRKIQNNYILAEAINGFSSGYSNSMAGNKTATYQTNTRGTISGNTSTLNYNQSQTGVIYYYDQAEVNRRNANDQQNMTNRINRFNSSLSSLDEAMMRSNTINPNQTEAGYIAAKVKQKNIQTLTITVTYYNETHILKFSN